MSSSSRDSASTVAWSDDVMMHEMQMQQEDLQPPQPSDLCGEYSLWSLLDRQCLCPSMDNV